MASSLLRVWPTVYEVPNLRSHVETLRDITCPLPRRSKQRSPTRCHCPSNRDNTISLDPLGQARNNGHRLDSNQAKVMQEHLFSSLGFMLSYAQHEHTWLTINHILSLPLTSILEVSILNPIDSTSAAVIGSRSTHAPISLKVYRPRVS